MIHGTVYTVCRIYYICRLLCEVAVEGRVVAFSVRYVEDAYLLVVFHGFAPFLWRRVRVVLPVGGVLSLLCLFLV